MENFRLKDQILKMLFNRSRDVNTFTIKQYINTRNLHHNHSHSLCHLGYNLYIDLSLDLC